MVCILRRCVWRGEGPRGSWLGIESDSGLLGGLPVGVHSLQRHLVAGEGAKDGGKVTMAAIGGWCQRLKRARLVERGNLNILAMVHSQLQDSSKAVQQGRSAPGSCSDL